MQSLHMGSNTSVQKQDLYEFYCKILGKFHLPLNNPKLFPIFAFLYISHENVSLTKNFFRKGIEKFKANSLQ